METISMKPIGMLHCDNTSRDDTPKSYKESEKTGTIEIEAQYLDALDGIEAGDRILVLFWFHQAKRDVLKVHPRGDMSKPIRGVFATRSPLRPNPIACSKLKVEKVKGCTLWVKGVDAFDKTPVLDIKRAACLPEEN